MKRKPKVKLPRVDKRNGAKREKSNIPDELDIILQNEKINKLIATLLEDGRRKDAKGNFKPVTENELKQLIRSAVRKRWMAHPTKLSFMEMGKVPDLDPKSRTRFRIQCNICQGWFKDTDVQCDHIKGENSFTSLSEALQWMSSILDVGYDDLQRLCLECHSTKTHMEATGLSFEEAKIDKQTITIQKVKGGDVKWLEARDIAPGKNSKIRKQQIIDKLKEETSGEPN